MLNFRFKNPALFHNPGPALRSSRLQFQDFVYSSMQLTCSDGADSKWPELSLSTRIAAAPYKVHTWFRGLAPESAPAQLSIRSATHIGF